MNREGYLYQLSRGISYLPEDIRNEILEEFTNHFDEGENNGLSEQEIIEQLGPVDELLQDIRNTYSDYSDDYENLKQGFDRVKDRVFSIIGGVISEFERRTAEKVSEILPESDRVIISLTGSGIDAEVQPGQYFTYSYRGHIFSDGEEPEISFENDGSRAMIEMARGDGRLTVTVPDVTRNLEIITSSGDIRVSDLDTDTLSVRTASGDLRLSDLTSGYISCRNASGDTLLEDCSADETELTAASGDIETDGGMFNQLHALTASGDIEIDDVRTDRLHVVATSGDIEVMVKEDYSELTLKTTSGDIELRVESDDFTADLSTISGDIDIDDDLYVMSHRKRSATVNDGEASIKMSTMSGDIGLYLD